ncbi:MAG: carbohydrate ABC transporter permease [Candidatus Limiplasma sp.]|nr:carbohydrate ABC transporter permease [Candidatus Limiplasma sp.]
MKKTKQWVFRLGRLVFLCLFLFIVLFPFYWQFLTSIKPTREITSMSLLPNFPTMTFDAYRFIMTERPFMRYIFNSLMVSLLTTAIAVTISSMAAYALARLNFKGKGWVLTSILAISMFPGISMISPIYLTISQLGLRNTWWGLLIPYLSFAMPLSVWYLTTFFKTIPYELEEAAKVDGCTPLQALVKVIVPLVMPGTFTTAILIFIQAWNEYLFSLTINTEDLSRTVTVGITMFRGEYTMPWVEQAAAIVTVTFPLAVVVFLLQRRIIAGLTSGAVKG